MRSGKIRGNLDLDSSGPPERAKTAHPVENSILLQFLLAHTLLPFLLQVDKSPYVSTYLPTHHQSPISRSHHTTITNISCDRPLYHHHKHWVNVYSCVAQNELSPFIILLKFDALRCPWFSSFAFGRQIFLDTIVQFIPASLRDRLRGWLVVRKSWVRGALPRDDRENGKSSRGVHIYPRYPDDCHLIQCERRSGI